MMMTHPELTQRFPTGDFGPLVFVEAGASIADDCCIIGPTQVWSNVRMGCNASLGANVVLEKPRTADDQGIVISARCRIDTGAVLCQNVTIGEGAHVKAGAVVEQSVPAHAIVSGVPARIIGYVENAPQGGLGAPERIKTSGTVAHDGMTAVGVGGVTLHHLKSVQDMRGDLSVGEFPKDIPFEPKRYFLVYNVPSEKTRGEHAHHACHQFLICVHGSCAVVVDDGTNRCEVLLDAPDLGLHLPPLTWGIQYKYSSDAVLLVFASHYYDAADYIRHYPEFLEITRRQPA
jgi:carbonic anhydrase/acetyltransferase-like protein (isoleucine patch superfamily)